MSTAHRMGILIHFEARIQCRGCGCSGIRDGNKGRVEIAELFIGDGWTLHGRGMSRYALCSECTKEQDHIKLIGSGEKCLKTKLYS